MAHKMLRHGDMDLTVSALPRVLTQTLNLEDVEGNQQHDNWLWITGWSCKKRSSCQKWLAGLCALLRDPSTLAFVWDRRGGVVVHQLKTLPLWKPGEDSSQLLDLSFPDGVGFSDDDGNGNDDIGEYYCIYPMLQQSIRLGNALAVLRAFRSHRARKKPRPLLLKTMNLVLQSHK